MPDFNEAIFLKGIVDELKATGDMSWYNDKMETWLNDYTQYLLNKNEKLSDIESETAGYIVEISNILYNNSSMGILPLEDGVYDLLLELYKQYNPNYLVGAPPVSFNEIEEDVEKDNMIKPIITVDQEFIDRSLYFDELNRTPPFDMKMCMQSPIIYNADKITKRLKDTGHVYPELVGTLDKCKFVLESEAYAYNPNALTDPKVKILERDFFGKHITSGILSPSREFTVIAELKYDGISVEAEVSDSVHTARSRGDTGNDVASDYTPIFGGYRFKNAEGKVNPDEIFGMKFEAVISYSNLDKLCRTTGKTYKNCRNAIIGMVSSADAFRYRDFITLVPLATSYPMDRITEIEFMNKYYNSGEYLRYAVIHGNYTQVLFQIKKFVDEASQLRSFLPIMYDGVVVSYLDQDLIKHLGRENSVNKYSMAIKFNSMVKQTIFKHYTFNVGKNGIITPLIHYKPIEFFGGIHTKSSGHSYKRFKELGLRKGDIVNVEYTNDVMPYCTKANVEANLRNRNPIEPFPTVCPECGYQLVSTESDNSMACINVNCYGRAVARMVDMLDRLGFKGFSDESVKALGIRTFTDFINLTVDKASVLGDKNGEKLIQQIADLKLRNVFDYKLIGSLGFTNVAEKKWKLLLTNIPIDVICYASEEELRSYIIKIKGAGAALADTICAERIFFMQDMSTIKGMPNVITSYGKIEPKRSAIRFTGFRDEALAEYLESLGFDADINGTVTKRTVGLLVPYTGYTSDKVTKALKNGTTTIMTVDDLMQNLKLGILRPQIYD